MANENESILQDMVDKKATDPIRTQVAELFASQGVELTDEQLDEAEVKAKQKVGAMIQNRIANTVNDAAADAAILAGEEGQASPLTEKVMNSFGTGESDAPATDTSSTAPESSGTSRSSEPSQSSEGSPGDTVPTQEKMPSDTQQSSTASSPTGTKAKRPKGLASRWGDKEWEQMSDSLKDGEDETKKEEESEEKKDTQTQTQTPTPATDEQIAKENEGEVSSNTSEDTPQTEPSSESNDGSPEAQKTQAEELQRQKNAEQSQIEQAEINRLQQEEIDQAQNQAIAGQAQQAQQKQQEAEEKKDDTSSSFMVKWLHGIRGWNGLGIITLLPVILFPGVLVGYVIASIVLEFALYKRGFVEAMINTIKLPSAVQEDFGVMFGRKKEKNKLFELKTGKRYTRTLAKASYGGKLKTDIMNNKKGGSLGKAPLNNNRSINKK